MSHPAFEHDEITVGHAAPADNIAGGLEVRLVGTRALPLFHVATRAVFGGPRLLTYMTVSEVRNFAHDLLRACDKAEKGHD
jgi:hypothetical protein